MAIAPKLLGAALLASAPLGTVAAQTIDPAADRLPRFYADVCGTGGGGHGNAAFFAPGSSDLSTGGSERHLRYVLDGAQQDGGWLLLTGHVDGAEAGDAGRLDVQRAEAVREWLIARGLRPDRVWSPGRGADDQIVATNGAEPQNRRVDFLLTSQGDACRRNLRSGIHAWFRQNCFPTLRAADTADCDEASRLLR